jgi:hypothetical protein
MEVSLALHVALFITSPELSGELVQVYPELIVDVFDHME